MRRSRPAVHPALFSPTRALARACAAVLTAALAAVALAAAPPTLAEDAGDGATAAAAAEVPAGISTHRLDNGFTVVIARRPGQPLTAVNLTVAIGAFDDPRGRSGMAHLLEHVTLTGTAAVGSLDAEREAAALDALDAAHQALAQARAGGEGAAGAYLKGLSDRLEEASAEAQRWAEPGEPYARLLESRGAVGLNAVTSWDTTQYFCRLPDELLPTWLEMEADRLRRPLMRSFYTEREAAILELSTLPDPSALELLYRRIYPGAARSLSAFGRAEELERIDRPAALAFLGATYRPDRMALAVVGDVDPEEVLALVERHFGDWPAPDRPYYEGGRRRPGEAQVISFEQLGSPAVMLGFPEPDGIAEGAALDAVEALLTSDQLSPFAAGGWEGTPPEALFTTAGFPGDRSQSMFVVQLLGRQSMQTEELERRSAALVAGLARAPEEELTAAILMAQRVLDEELSDPSLYAARLAHAQAVHGDWRRLFEHRQALADLTPESVRRVVTDHLTSPSAAEAMATTEQSPTERSPADRSPSETPEETPQPSEESP